MELTRKQVIEILEKVDSTVYKEPKTKTAQALEYAIASLETDEAYQLEYERTTKNDLGFDCISRADAIQAIQDTAKKLTNEDTINGLCGAVAILYEMPSTTPIRPKGHWKLVQRGKFIDVCCSNCEAVRIKEYAYNYTIDQLDKEDLKEYFEGADMSYCPNCGAKMVEPQESEEV